MAKDPKGFLKYKRQNSKYREVDSRVKDYKEVFEIRSNNTSQEQTARCLDCGTPFCMFGCPVGNIMPEWQEMILNGNWNEAYDLLSSTNNLPEMTGRVCPAPCEYACVLGINEDPVSIRENELDTVEKAFASGHIKPTPPKNRTGKKIAIIGSGPSGIAAADQLNKVGHSVVVFEKESKVGGLLRYGIPDFKLDKSIIDRRVDVLQKEGIIFKTNTEVGIDIDAGYLKSNFDAICLCGGSKAPRDLKIEGRELKGVYFAMDFLRQSNKRVSSEKYNEDDILATKRDVLVIGGGDTGSDCIGTSNRQGAKSITQFEVMPTPSKERTQSAPWPNFPLLLKTTSSHGEGCERRWSVLTKKFVGDENGRVKEAHCVEVDFSEKDSSGREMMKEVAGSEFVIKTDFVVLAIGFLHPVHYSYIEELGVGYDGRGNVEIEADYKTSVDNIFSSGDMNIGQSLVVRAISDARRMAYNVDKYLSNGKTLLPFI